jgi:hypothetical protein
MSKRTPGLRTTVLDVASGYEEDLSLRAWLSIDRLVTLGLFALSTAMVVGYHVLRWAWRPERRPAER